MLFFFICVLVKKALCFNLESRNVWNFTIQDNSSYFGYQVSLVNTNSPKVIISAPLYTGKSATGVVFSCNPDDTNQCLKLNIETETLTDPDLVLSQKSNQWMGFSMSQAGDMLMSCAPLWHESRTGRNGVNLWYRGRCSLIDKDLNNIYTYSACVNEQTSNVQYGYCESGFSSGGYIGGNSPTFYVGAPGSINSIGVLFAFIGGSVDASPIKLKTGTDQLIDESSLMGYSIAVGNFTNNQYGDVVGGAPRANNLRGIVILYTIGDAGFTLTQSYPNPDGQVGSYFGGAVCAVDLNNDGIDDLLVGSPQYSVVTDEGRVYIYMNKPIFTGLQLQKNFLAPDSTIGARFGSVISKIGDINKDGYQDVAIAAPGGGPDGKGAVYIYNGGVNGIILQYSQVVYASTFSSDFGTGFGSSISGGLDVDGNNYPDVVIGAFNIGKVFLLRSRPVVSLSANLQTNITQVPAEPENANCLGPNGVSYYCIELRLNLMYDANKMSSDYSIEVTIEVDNQMIIGKRGFFFNSQTKQLSNIISQNITLVKNKIAAIPTIVYISVTGEVDLLNPITITTSYKEYPNPLGCGNVTCPMLDLYGIKTGSIQVTYLKKCKNDICYTDLSMSSILLLPGASQQSQIIYGVIYEVDVVSKIINYGDTAYQSSMNILFSLDLQVISVTINGQPYPSVNPIKVDPIAQELSILLSNAQKSNQSIDILARFSIPLSSPSTPVYIFQMSTTSYGVDVNPSNNNVTLQVPTMIATCVRVQGQVFPTSIYYKKNFSPPSKYVSVVDIGPEVNFTFYIQNAGRFPVDTISSEISFVVNKQNFDLIYVVDMRVDGVQCNPLQNNLNINNYTTLYSNSTTQDIISRKKRQVFQNIDCQNGNCKVYTCNITRIENNKGSTVLVTTRLWAASLAKLSLPASEMQTFIQVRFNGKDRNVQQDNCPLSLMVNFTLQESIMQPVTKQVSQWWIILLSILGALVLLAVSSAILYKFGFFERDKSFKGTSHTIAFEQKVQSDDADNVGSNNDVDNVNPNNTSSLFNVDT
ncbi:integrin alpha-8 isoform X3 [Hydra vulgaris]|uniref:Integrin alpha-8 isoform X3 n=1 Tax=Hydra vulgaris TaxID=6087 RepID=A0ABM4CXH2_HYDVU